MSYTFTNNWFNVARGIWDQLLPNIAPRTVLEIGCYEGASTVYLMEMLGKSPRGELHCVDTWGGGVEHGTTGSFSSDMRTVEVRFHENVSSAARIIQNPVDLTIHKGTSAKKLVELLAGGKEGYFDFVYVDGSHQAPDVICDAILGFKLLRIGGIMAFDDYLWAEQSRNGIDPLRCPKLAIDSFTNLYCRKLRIISAPLYQLYIQKTHD